MQLMRMHQSHFARTKIEQIKLLILLKYKYSTTLKYWFLHKILNYFIQSPLKQYIFTGMNVNKAIFSEIL
jgi:hypothetical protein